MNLTISFLPRNSSFDLTKKNYRIVDYVGKGQFGNAYKVENIIDHKIWLAKCIDLSQMDEDDKKRSLQEAEIMKNIDNPYVIKCHESFIHDDIYLVIVMEYCNKGDIGKVIESCIFKNEYLPQDKILKWSSQIAAGIYYLHNECKIIHRDIKPSNIFIKDNDDIVIGDFGISRIMQTMPISLTLTSIGTPQYMSPEMCENKPYTYKSDIWSFGCVLYELIALKPPFSGDSLLSLAWNISFQEIKPLPETFSKELFLLIKQLLSKSPAVRPDPEEILDNAIFSDYKSSLLYLPRKTSNSEHEDHVNFIEEFKNNNKNGELFDFKIHNISGKVKRIASAKAHLNYTYELNKNNHSKYNKTISTSALSTLSLTTHSILPEKGLKNLSNELSYGMNCFDHQYFFIILGRVQYHLENYIKKLIQTPVNDEIIELIFYKFKCFDGIDLKEETVTVEWFDKFIKEISVNMSRDERSFFLIYIDNCISQKVHNSKKYREIQGDPVNTNIKYSDKAFMNLHKYKNSDNISYKEQLNELQMPKIYDFISKIFSLNKIKVNYKQENAITKKHKIKANTLSETDSKVELNTDSEANIKSYFCLSTRDLIRIVLKPILALNSESKMQQYQQNIKNITLEEGFYLFDKKNSGTLSKQHFRAVLYLLFPKLTFIQLDWLFALAPKDYSGNIIYEQFLNFIEMIQKTESKNANELVEHTNKSYFKHKLIKHVSRNIGLIQRKYNFIYNYIKEKNCNLIENNIKLRENNDLNYTDKTVPGAINSYYELFNNINSNFNDDTLTINENIDFNDYDDLYCLNNCYFDYNAKYDISANGIQELVMLYSNNSHNLRTLLLQQLLSSSKDRYCVSNRSKCKNDLTNKSIKAISNVKSNNTLEIKTDIGKKIIRNHLNEINIKEKNDNHSKLIINDNDKFTIDNSSVEICSPTISMKIVKEPEKYLTFEIIGSSMILDIIKSEEVYKILLIISNNLENLIYSLQIERLYTCWTTAKVSENKNLINKLEEVRNLSTEKLSNLILHLNLLENENLSKGRFAKYYLNDIYELGNALFALKNDIPLQRDAIDCILKIINEIKSNMNIKHNDRIKAEMGEKNTNFCKDLFKQVIRNKVEFKILNTKHIYQNMYFKKNTEKDNSCDLNSIKTKKIVKTKDRKLFSKINKNEHDKTALISKLKDFDARGKFLASFEFFTRVIVKLIKYSTKIMSIIEKMKKNIYYKQTGRDKILSETYLIENYNDWSYLKEHVSRECAFVALTSINCGSNRDLESVRLFLELLGARRYHATVTLKKQNKVEKKLFKELYMLEEIWWNAQKQRLSERNFIPKDYEFNSENWLLVGEKACIVLHNTCVQILNEI